MSFFDCSAGRLIVFLFSGRRRTAEKRAEATEKEISELRAALDSKEKDLQAHRNELAQLQRAEEEFSRVEAVECERLRVVASSLTGE